MSLTTIEAAAAAAKGDGNTLLAISVNRALSDTFLAKIASEPTEKHIAQVEGLHYLEFLARYVSEQCHPEVPRRLPLKIKGGC